MRAPAPLAAALALAAATTTIVGAQAPQSGVTLDLLLVRAASYLNDFVEKFANVVAEERYVQDSNVALPTLSIRSSGRGAPPMAAPLPDVSRHRELKSDFLLVKSLDTDELIPFRDVFEVDGVAVRDREQRLAKLFVKPSPSVMGQAYDIREESARYNLGSIQRTFNTPVFALAVVQRDYQSRFRFSLGKEDRRVGDGVWTVEYDEQAHPAMIRGMPGQDYPAHGRVWIEADSGRALKTELVINQPGIRATVTTSFRMDERFGIAVPVEMTESYDLNGSKLTGSAGYGRFRRFDVTAEEDVRSPRK